ncbi:MAG: hypothetical protein NDI62_01570 [Burkholderiales bacterium]|nr:hypothetical protein [Burkholderiales bacterium]
MDIFKHLDKNNLHHAYLIEGAYEEVVPEIFSFIESLGIATNQNPDFSHIILDSFKIEDARNLKTVEYEKGFSGNKKIFLITANNFLLEAQNTLLKIFEEPIEDTHFFLVVPNKNILLKTLLSRFYVISTKKDQTEEIKKAEQFIKMNKKERIEFIKELLTDAEEDEEDDLSIREESPRSKCINLLNAVEFLLQNKFITKDELIKKSLQICFAHILKVRQFLNQPGSAMKTLMESVALIIPNF